MKTNFVALLVIAVMLCAVSGCESDQLAQLIGRWESAKLKMEDAKAPTTRAIADVDAEVALLPADDPVRLTWETELRPKYERSLAELERVKRTGDAMLTALVTADVSDPELRDAVGTIPGVGPYAGLIVVGAGWLLTAIGKMRTKRALEQTVVGVEAALPDKTQTQKLLLGSAQDEATKRLVAQIKAELPPKTEASPVVLMSGTELRTPQGRAEGAE